MRASAKKASCKMLEVSSPGVMIMVSFFMFTSAAHILMSLICFSIFARERN